jgi:hypothetical protein
VPHHVAVAAREDADAQPVVITLPGLDRVAEEGASDGVGEQAVTGAERADVGADVGRRGDDPAVGEPVALLQLVGVEELVPLEVVAVSVDEVAVIPRGSRMRSRISIEWW